MSSKIPQIDLIDFTKLDFKKFDGFAVPVGQKEEKPFLNNQAFIKALAKAFPIDLNSELKKWPDFLGKSGEILEIPIVTGKEKRVRIFLVGTGEGKREDLKKAGISLARKVKGSGQKIASGLVTEKAFVTNFVMSLILASFTWNLKSPKKEDKGQASFAVIGKSSELIDGFENGVELATGVWLARELIHTPSNIKNPKWLADQAQKLVEGSKNSALKIDIKSGAQLKEFGGLRAVGNSAPTPGPRFIEIKYRPRGGKNAPHVVLVGKGITFDTGGVSLKRPYEIMSPMKSDMAGAAAVLATLLTVAKLDAKVNVTGLMMVAENSVSGTSQRPSDVITHYGGTTVEVIDTDAEGRLVLADGLAYAEKNLKPDFLIDIATLTGSATLGLGRQYAAMYTRNEKLAERFSQIGERIGERVWHMPLIDDYKSALRSDVADFNHTADKEDFGAGSVTAALFLEHFAGKIGEKGNWLHLDIAGVGRSEGDSGENPKGGTGFGVRLLSEWIGNL
jgi:leucyl aminopeptidase